VISAVRTSTVLNDRDVLDVSWSLDLNVNINALSILGWSVDLELGITCDD
jgi:hypothetical protein